MECLVYFTSDGSMMSEDDIITMLNYYACDEEYKNWSFDEMTGGESEFVSYEEYIKAKTAFLNIKR